MKQGMEERVHGHLRMRAACLAAGLLLAGCGSVGSRSDNPPESSAAPAIVVGESSARPAASEGKRLYLDVHRLGAGNVRAEDVAAAHQKDLAVQAEFGVSFLEYWVDEASGCIYCLSEAPSREAVIATHEKAHGLLPDDMHDVVRGE